MTQKIPNNHKIFHFNFFWVIFFKKFSKLRKFANQKKKKEKRKWKKKNSLRLPKSRSTHAPHPRVTVHEYRLRSYPYRPSVSPSVRPVTGALLELAIPHSLVPLRDPFSKLLAAAISGLRRLLSSSSVSASVSLWCSVCVIPTTTYMATLRCLHLAPYSRYGISLGLAHHRGLSFHRELGFVCVCVCVCVIFSPFSCRFEELRYHRHLQCLSYVSWTSIMGNNLVIYFLFIFPCVWRF